MQNQAQNDDSFFAPVCEVCQSQDESLRAVSYPFVFSVIFASFQRAFSGVFCAKHQRRYHLFASLITSTVGWLGIPFGFFLTPLTLLKLARGGIVNTEESLQILNLIADKKLRTGDIKGAIRCLEEQLKFQDNSETRERLTRLYSQSRNLSDANVSEYIWQFLSVAILLITSVITGFFIGLLDTLFAYFLYPVVGESGSIFVAILSWVPGVTMLFLEVLLIRFLLRWTLRKGRITSILLGIILTVVSTFFAFYSFLEGQSVVRTLQALTTFFSVSATDGFFALRSILTHGGIDVLINNFQQGGLPNIIFGILFSFAGFLALYTGIETALQTTHWQSRLSQLQNTLVAETNHSSTLVWVTLSLFVLGMVFLAALVYPGSFVNIEETHSEINLGISNLDQNHSAEAVKHFRQAVDLWPDSVTGHTYLGMGFYSQEKYDQALKELEQSLRLDPNSMITRLIRAYVFSGQGKYIESIDEYEFVSKSQPQWGLPHAALANLYFILDQTEAADKEIQAALAYEANDGQTSSGIASYYVQVLDFDKAEEHMLKAIKTTNNPEDYLFLARIYIMQNDFDRAEKVVEEASTQGADPVNVYLARINSAEYQGDLETASSLLTEAMKSYSDHSDLYSENSYVLFQKGNIAEAAKHAERAVELNPYNALGYVEMAFAYHAQGSLNDALIAAQKGLALHPKYDRLHYILGRIYMDLGMKEEAIREFETFLKLYWDRPLARQYKENVVIYLEKLK